MTRGQKQLRAYKGELAFERLVVVLRTELDAGTERRHLDRLIELLELHVENMDGTVLTAGYRATLAPLKLRVGQVSHLRVVR
jgi:hypothetical protein